MAVGWAGDNAVNEQIQSSIDEAVELARSRLPGGESRTHCEECGEQIPQRRRQAVPGVRLCITCQEEYDQEVKRASSHYNRRGSKDSQLR